MGSLSFFLLTYALIKIEVTESFLLNCKNIGYDIAKEWFIQGQLYSYCTYLKVEEGQQPSSILVDESCNSVICYECMKACNASKPFNLINCLSDCNSTSCEFGCKFYTYLSGATNESFQTNVQNMPYIDSSFKVNPTEVQDLSITFQWPVVTSKFNFTKSIYLLTITVNQEENTYEVVLGLASENMYIMLEENFCFYGDVNYYRPGVTFQVNVYPINYNGYNTSTTITSNFTTFQQFSSLKSVTILPVSSPTYGTPTSLIVLQYNLIWNYPKDFETICKKLELKSYMSGVQCANSENKEWTDIINKQTTLYPALNQKTALFNFFNLKDSTDQLSFCNLSVMVTPQIGKCSVGTITNVFIPYPGCANIPSYDSEYCTNPSSTTPAPTAAPILRRYNISELYYEKTNGTNFSSPFYNITLSWYTPTSVYPIKEYKITYFQSSIQPIDVGSYTELFQTAYIPNALQNESSYIFTYLNPGMFFLYYIYAFTGIIQYDDNNFRAALNSNYETIIIPGIPTNSSTTTTPSQEIPLTTQQNNKTAIIIAAVLVPVSVTLIIFVIVVVVLKLRKKKKFKQKFNTSCGNIYSFEEYIEFQRKTDGWEIYSKTITFDKKIGEGAYGTVYVCKISANILAKTKYACQKSRASLLALNEEHTVNVAVKCLKDGANDSEIKDFREEINLMKGIGFHKNIVNMIGCSTTMEPLCLMVEFMENGDLLQFLRNRRNKLCISKVDGDSAGNFIYTTKYQDSLETTTSKTSTKGIMPNDVSLDDNGAITPDDLLSFAWQVASGMEYLSSINLVHRDLAARNILVGADKNVKISDFGLTRKIDDEQLYMSSQTRRLPIKWMSVEAIFDHTFTPQSDVWAYGVVLFEIVTLGGTPYPAINNRELMSLLKTGYRMDRPDNCSEQMYDIMLHCWNEDPLQRPSFTDLSEHLEGIISQGDRYFTFDIDEENTYYNVASFNSLSPETDDDVLANEIFQKPIQVKSIEETKKIGNESTFPVTKRYTDPEFFKSAYNSKFAPGLNNLAFNDAITDSV
ncbi:macrophage colony-stimulating factor 1 receptor 2-like [Hydra vulgaris]|uniref:Macrophage colony-stimulating factor 1 receptor 2-like n=1 Tax=Hydra vulgaris TaxID=6087 RepID=A0ABM4B7U7_HYDVU